MATSPFTSHANTLADYLAWLNAGVSTPGTNADLPFFTWQDNDYTCNFTWTEQKFLTDGGYVSTQILVIEILDPLPAATREDGVPGPALKDIITFLDKSWRVEIIKHASGKNPQLTCWDPNRGT